MSQPTGFLTPPIPVPTRISDIPPATSEVLVVSNNPVNPLYILNHSTGAYESLYKFPWNLTPPFPSPVTIQFIVYWKRLYYDLLPADQPFSKTITHTKGMTKTDSETLSAEIGVGFDGLSAKLSATIGQSVSTTEETEVSTTFSLTPKKHKSAVVTIWCLVEKYTFLHGNEILNYAGTASYIPDFPVTYSVPNISRINTTNIVRESITYFPST